MAVNDTLKSGDLELWAKYKSFPTPDNRSALLRRFENVIQSQVNKWAGPVSREVLTNEAKLLAVKAFDSYDSSKGTALATHVMNNLAPLSRVVYTAQNTARLPENIVLQIHSYGVAKEALTNRHGREPSYDELHQELGWPLKHIERMESYQRRNLVESGSPISAEAFYSDVEDRDSDVLAAVYHDLLPEEKTLFDMVTGGVHGGQALGNVEIMKRTGMTQAQLSYKKTLLKNKLDKLLNQARGRMYA